MKINQLFAQLCYDGLLLQNPLAQRAVWLPALLLLCSASAFAQRPYTVIRPSERSLTERVVVTAKPQQPNKSVLAVVLSPKIDGKIVIKDATGRIITEENGGERGQAEISLPRGKAYEIEASAPGYLSTSSKTKLTKQTEIVRLDLVAQSASIKLLALPPNAQILLDDQPRETANSSGTVVLNDIAPGSHTLRIRHPEYNDYIDTLTDLQAGEEVRYGRIPLTRVTRLTVKGPAGATVLIDDAFEGKIGTSGQVEISYELKQAVAEHTISVELLGYQTRSQRELLKPGPRTIEVKLDPVTTSAGVSDFFDNLSLWSAPSTWKIIGDAKNKRLEVHGEQPGILTDKTYRDFEANFTLWLNDGKGASWVVRADRAGKDYYLFHLAGPNATTHTPRRFYTYLVKDGAAPVEVSTPVPLLTDLNTKSSYTISLTVRDYVIQHAITSNETAERNDLGIYTDTEKRFLFGSFGFRALAGEVFQVDDLNLEPLAKP